MSQEKKNLTEEERKDLKEGLKKKIDEMSDEELSQISGGEYFETKEEAIFHANGVGVCPYCGRDFGKKCPKCGEPCDNKSGIKQCKKCGEFFI